jgi:PAS domain S-box-containing protein
VGPFLFLYAALTGFFAFAAIYHFVLWLSARRETLLVVFSADCLLRAGFCAVLVAIACSATPEEAQQRFGVRVAVGLLVMVTWLWSLSLVSGVRARWFVLPVAVLLLILFVLQTCVVALHPPVLALESLVLPWGETLSDPRLGPARWWFGPIYAVVLSVEGFGAYCAYRLWVRDRVAGGLVALVVCGLVLVHIREMMKVLGVVPGPYIGVLPMVVWVCVIALLIARTHRRTRALLTASEDRFRTLAEEASDGIFVADYTGRYLDVNSAGCRMLGYSRAEILTLSIPDVVVDTELGRLGPEIAKLQSGGAVRSEWLFQRKDGTVFEGEVNGRLLPNNRMLGVVRDVTERKRADRALRESEARFRTLVENAPEAIVVYEVGAQRFVDVNEKAVQLFGLSREELLRTGPVALSPPDQPDGRSSGPLAAEYIRRAVGGETPVFEWVHRSATGREVVCEVRLVRLPASGRTLIRGSLTDITERKRAEDARRVLESQLAQAQKMEAVGRLAGGVAHDFNNLLTVINGYGELLRASARDGPNRTMLAGIVDACERAQALTRQLLTFSRQQVVEPRVIDLNAVVADTGRMLERLIGEDVRLETVLHPHPTRVLADPGQIGQVLMNLAVNARDAMPRGGVLTVETGAAEIDETFVQVRPEARTGRFALLAVSDTGGGMAPEVLNRIFEPFFTTKGPGKGTGLGLATVRTIADQCKGFLSVYSEPGRGSTFKLYLPALSEVVLADEPDPFARAAPHGTETILLVEDEDAVRALTRRILEQFGYTVVEAPGGADALRFTERYSGPLDLLVTDVVLPGLNGRELAERLERMRPGLRVLYLSGYTDDAVVAHGVLHAEVAFLQKPFTMEALARKVRHTLDAPPRP